LPASACITASIAKSSANAAKTAASVLSLLRVLNGFSIMFISLPCKKKNGKREKGAETRWKRIELPFDPVKRSGEVERAVMHGDRKKYYRFRYAGYYGGIATADTVGCNLLCTYCWNYYRNLYPET